MTSEFLPSSNLYKIKFYALGDDENNIESHVEVKNKDLFRNNVPFPFGVYDSKLGTTDHGYVCNTCMGNKLTCGGHFGKINLPFPVMSPMFRKEIIKWLKIICFNCGKCIIPFKSSLQVEKSQILYEYVKSTRTTNKNIKCVHCNTIHPNITKDSKDYLRINSGNERLYNHQIEEILGRVTDETVLSLGKSLDSHPKKFILRTIKVPPVTIRPDIKKIRGGRSNNNDLTTMLKNIIMSLDKLPPLLDDKTIVKNILQLDSIEMQYYSLIRDIPVSNLVKIQTNLKSSLASITSRFQKKTGRIRKNILGKRTTYMARSVITGDNFIKLGEVGVPLSIARNEQIPEVVQPYNKDKLMIYFNNKDKVYPGCSKVIKKSNGAEYYIGAVSDDFILEYGDIIYRDLVDGDCIAMNRAPSLLYCSISGMVVRVLEQGDTFRISPSIVDTIFGGDFDGDAMNAIIPHKEISKNECKNLSGIPNWCISLKDGSPMFGVYHDSLIGVFEFTKNDITLDRFNSMKLLNQCIENIILEDKNNFTSREVISKLFPFINFSKKAGFYNSDYEEFINYKKDEINVEFDKGQLIRGRLDKKTIGQGVNGSIIHVICNEYGPDVAINVLYNIQQLSSNYLMKHGLTINYDDITVSEETLNKIHEQTYSILYESNSCYNDLIENKLITPLGMTLMEFYEQQQLSILNTGDAFLKPVFEGIDPEKNDLYKLIASGSKGKFTNFLQISSSIGQTSIGGQRMKKIFDYERGNPYYPRFNDDPRNRGFVTSSYATGVDMLSFIFLAMEARFSIINKALSTSITGAQNRQSIKNLESLYINNLRQVVENKNIVQFVYGNDGVNIQQNEIVKFNGMTIPIKEFEQKYKTDLSDVEEIYKNKGIAKILNEEYNILLKCRNEYREIYLGLEKQYKKNKLFTDVKSLSVNIYRIMEDILHNYKEELKEKNTINPNNVYEKVNDLCKKIEYTHYNEIQEKNNKKIPEYIHVSFTLINIFIRNYLYIKNIIKLNISENLLDLIITRIINTYRKSLVQYGTPCGIITAQSVSEPMTQFVLDSPHHSGTGTKVSFLTRMKEIFSARDTHKMKMPIMTLHVKKEYMSDILKVANYIEMIPLQLFILSCKIFFEDYKEIKHPDYQYEIKMIETFETHSPNITIPNNLVKWCIRLEFNKEKLIEKSMKFEDILIKLYTTYPNIFLVYNTENSTNVIMRIYFMSSFFKKNQVINLELIKSFVKDDLLKCIIRGINNIYSTDTTKTLARTIINDDDSLTKIVENVITTDGTNFEDICYNDYIDPYISQSNSIMEIYELFGIEAAKNKIISELLEMIPGANSKHYNIYADLMCFTGNVTSIDKIGIESREVNNILLNLSTSHSIQGLEAAAINSCESYTNIGLSPPIMVGTMPKFGTNYNEVCLNEKFISNNVFDVESQLEDL